jgi:phospholipid/cholesterol/gamma-HCH transport system substrate-binding protein
MDETRRNVMVGLFVLCGLVALGGLILLFGQGPRWLVRGNTYTLTVVFDSVAGVRSGTPVTVKGKQIGHVQDVRFARAPGAVDDGQPRVIDLAAGVEVILAIESRYRLPVGSQAETVAAGLLGGGRPPIEIALGDPAAGYLEPDVGRMTGVTRDAMSAIFPTDMVANFDRTAVQIGEAAAALKPVLHSLNAMLEPRSPADVDVPDGAPGNLASAATRLDALLKHFNAVLGDPDQQSRLIATLDNVHGMSADGREMMANLKRASTEAETVIARTGAVVDQADAAVANFDRHLGDVARATLTDLEKAGRVLDQLQSAATDVAQGDGTVGKLLRDDRLYEAAVLTARRLAAVIEDFGELIKEWRKGKIRVAF